MVAAPPGKAGGFRLLLPVRRLLQPARYGRERRTTVVVIDHLLDVVVVVGPGALPVADEVVGPVAVAGNVAGKLRESLSPDPDVSRPLRRRGITPFPLLPDAGLNQADTGLNQQGCPPDALGHGPAKVRPLMRQPAPALNIPRVGMGERLRRGATP